MLLSSKYNYYLPYKNKKVIVFNGISKRFFLISESNTEEMKAVIEHPEKYVSREDYHPLISDLLNGGFIFDENLDEKDLIVKHYYDYVNDDTYLLIIMTTYDCNFHCWYCTQSHKNENLTDATVGRIKKHIAKYLIDNKIKKFVLSWFGGEPSLQYDRIIDISLFAKQFCREHGVIFSNGITTNGSLLSDAMIEGFSSCNLNRYQITIDGIRAMHNKVRFNNMIKDSFNVICNNIMKIIDNVSNPEVVLRYNYTSKNLSLDIIDDLNVLFPADYRSKIEFFPRKVWQEEESKIDNSKLERLYDKATNSGYCVNQIHDIVNNMCYAERKHFNTIFQNGEVDKCSNLNDGGRRGILDELGNIIWNGRLLEYDSLKFPYSMVCSECRHLPVCMGVCPVYRRVSIEQSLPFKCVFDNPDKSISASIRSYVSGILSYK